TIRLLHNSTTVYTTAPIILTHLIAYLIRHVQKAIWPKQDVTNFLDSFRHYTGWWNKSARIAGASRILSQRRQQRHGSTRTARRAGTVVTNYSVRILVGRIDIAIRADDHRERMA